MTSVIFAIMMMRRCVKHCNYLLCKSPADNFHFTRLVDSDIFERLSYLFCTLFSICACSPDDVCCHRACFFFGFHSSLRLDAVGLIGDAVIDSFFYFCQLAHTMFLHIDRIQYMPSKKLDKNLSDFSD